MKPVRSCLDCGAYLTSANEDDYCAEHGGWITQELSSANTFNDRADLYRELEELMVAA